MKISSVVLLVLCVAHTVWAAPTKGYRDRACGTGAIQSILHAPCGNGKVLVTLCGPWFGLVRYRTQGGMLQTLKFIGKDRYENALYQMVREVCGGDPPRFSPDDTSMQ